VLPGSPGHGRLRVWAQVPAGPAAVARWVAQCPGQALVWAQVPAVAAGGVAQCHSAPGAGLGTVEPTNLCSGAGVQGGCVAHQAQTAPEQGGLCMHVNVLRCACVSSEGECSQGESTVGWDGA